MPASFPAALQAATFSYYELIIVDLYGLCKLVFIAGRGRPYIRCCFSWSGKLLRLVAAVDSLFHIRKFLFDTRQDAAP